MWISGTTPQPVDYLKMLRALNKIKQAIILIFSLFFMSFSLHAETIKNNVDSELISRKNGEYILTQSVRTTLTRAQKILNSYDQLYRLMPGVLHSTVAQSGKNYKILDQVYKANYTFGLSIPATLLVEKINANHVQYHLLKSDRIHELSGEIVLQEIDNQHVLIIDKIHIDPIVPFFLRTLFFKRFKNQLAVSKIKIHEFFSQFCMVSVKQ